MIIPAFRNLRIRAKLVSVTLFLVLVPLMGVAYLSLSLFGEALRKAAEEDLEHLVRTIHSMCKVQQEMVKTRWSRTFAWPTNFCSGKARK